MKVPWREEKSKPPSLRCQRDGAEIVLLAVSGVLGYYLLNTRLVEVEVFPSPLCSLKQLEFRLSPSGTLTLWLLLVKGGWSESAGAGRGRGYDCNGLHCQRRRDPEFSRVHLT